MTFRSYLMAMDIAMRERMPASEIRFDPARGTWTHGRHEVRVSAARGRTLRFGLFTTGKNDTLVGSYTGTVGAMTEEVAQYLVYFLETGKPWHRGLPTKGLA